MPICSLWLNRVFTDLSNSGEKHCLTIDCSTENRNGQTDMQTLISTFSGELESQQDLNFFQDDNNAPK